MGFSCTCLTAGAECDILTIADSCRCGGMVDTGDLKSPGSDTVPVRVRSPAPQKYRGVEQLVARRAHNPEVVGSSPAPATIKAPLSSRKAVLFFHFCNFFGRPHFLDTEVTQTVTQTGQKIGPEAAFPPPGFLSFLWRQRAFARTFPMVFAASFWAAVVTWA